MEMARHLEILRTEGARLAAVPTDALDAPVPTVEGWTLERVVCHTGKIQQWVTSVLALEPGQGMDEVGKTPGMPRGPACVAAYAESLDALLAAFGRHDPAEPWPTFAGSADVAWWARRLAHEVSIHRTDAEDAIHAVGGPAPDGLTPDGAADGVDEWAQFFLAVRWNQRYGEMPADLTGRTVHIHGTDDPTPADGAEWLITFGSGGCTVETSHAKGDVALRGPAEDLFRVIWRRRPLDTLDVIGDRAVAERMLEIARF